MKPTRYGRIALIEDDAAIAGPILSALRGAGHSCHRFATGAAALKEIDRSRFDLMLIDRAVNDMPAAKLMTGVRARIGFALPVIGLARSTDAVELQAALDEGADDCLGQPVPPRLLLAQINAALRRTAPAATRMEATIGHLGFQPDGTKVYVDDAAVILTAKEYALALMLCRNVGTALSRDHILRTIWGENVAPATRTLDVHASRLRTKLDLRPERGFRLTALYGRGYRLDYDRPPGGGGRRVVSPRRSASPSAPV